jgi:tRNA 5-methylaminomethyl-2-thiouridine biosynthesis bifunctional protein
MVDPASALLLNASGQFSWRVFDTQFNAGLDFLRAWRAWRVDPSRPRELHYVALTDSPPSWTDLKTAAAGEPDIEALADELSAQWFGLLPGFHRFTLADGHVLLTLCVGDVSTLLRQQQFLADAVHLKAASPETVWDLWTVKALARCCRRGTRLLALDLSNGLRSHLVQCGFEFEPGHVQGIEIALAAHPQTARHQVGLFNPRWVIKHSRSSAHARDQVTPATVIPGTCAVIGAGLAGASVAAALARRGWQVQVLDAAATAAAGASGLPVGLVVPHVSADDCTLSKLSRSGVRLMLQQAATLLRKGQDWDATGTLERRFEGATGLAANRPKAGQPCSRPALLEPAVAEWLRASGTNDADMASAIWHAKAAWLKPAQLVQAWLSQPGITFQAQAAVAALRPEGAGWALLDAAGQVLACADRVVIANAMGALPLLESLRTTLSGSGVAMGPLPALQGVPGQLSWALHAGAANDAFPAFPVNGSGSVIPRVPYTGGTAWFVGSSYQAPTQGPCSETENHASNLKRLSALLPGLGVALAPGFTAAAVNSWQNTRCVTADRLPMVGPLMAPTTDATQSSVWMCAGMGSRGLTFSALCAELLAAQWGSEPLPVESSLAATLSTLRATGFLP